VTGLLRLHRAFLDAALHVVLAAANPRAVAAGGQAGDPGGDGVADGQNGDSGTAGTDGAGTVTALWTSGTGQRGTDGTNGHGGGGGRSGRRAGLPPLRQRRRKRRRGGGGGGGGAGDLDALVVHLRYSTKHRRRWRSTNLLERSLAKVKRRTKVIGRFPGEISCLTLVWAVLDLYITHAKNGMS
jgi:hypothetical protein